MAYHYHHLSRSLSSLALSICLTLVLQGGVDHVLVSGHFVMQVPTSLGFSDVNEGTAPCGGFDITNRDTVTDWPIAGGPIQVVTTHPEANWEVRAALLSDTSHFAYMEPPFVQDGLGFFCLADVPGIADWVGKDAVLQMIQHAVDGALYQCAAIRFVAGTQPLAVPASCTNGSGFGGAQYTSLPATALPSDIITPSPVASGSASATGRTYSNSTMSSSSVTPTPTTSKGANDGPRLEVGGAVVTWLTGIGALLAALLV